MKLIAHYFPELSQEKFTQLSKLNEFYRYWNAQINVISRKDMDCFYQNHVLHSLSIAMLLHFSPNTKVMDLGTGGGFPGIPLAIMFPQTQFVLVDSIRKKTKVVRKVIEALQLSNVIVLNLRAEDVIEKFDFIVSRAVTQMGKFIPLVKNKIRLKQKNALHNGILYLKGGDLSDELKNIPCKQFSISKWFEEPFFETKKIIHVGL